MLHLLEAEYVRGLKEQHMEKYKHARLAVASFIQRSLSYPKEVLCIQMDAMDNTKVSFYSLYLIYGVKLKQNVFNYVICKSDYCSNQYKSTLIIPAVIY